MKTQSPSRILIAAALLLAGVAGSSEADVRRMGATFNVISAASRGSAAAHDSRHDVYLVVSAHGVTRGRFVSADGGLIGEPFVIQTTGNFTHFPRVGYSPDANNGAGAFLVTWHESDRSDGFTTVRARMIAYPGTALGTEVILGTPSWWEAGAAISYATGSREFLVAWRRAAYGITAARVNNAGQLLATIDVTPAVAYQNDASVAYNPTADEFLVAYRGYDTSAFVGARRIQAGTGQIIGAEAILTRTVGTYITDTAYNHATNQFLVSWYPAPSGTTSGRLVSASGTPVGDVLPLSSRFTAYDALSLSYNRLSATFLLSSHDLHTAENGGVHLNANGVPENAGVLFTEAGGFGNFYPMLGASASRPEWLLTTARNFGQTVAQRLQTNPGAGTTPPDPGPAPPPPPPAPPVSNPIMNIDGPANNATAAGHVVVAGWAIDVGAPTGHGVETVHVWAWPTNGSSAIFVGAGTPVSRPDVGAAYGDARFSAGGFAASSALPPGTYDIVAYAKSTVTGTFNNSQGRRVTVTAPPTIPRMAVDMPAANQFVSQNFRVAGWAIDVGSPTGTGVDAVHVWAYPAAGGAPLLVGVASLGHSRPDVAAAFGASRFGTSGYNLMVNGTLPPGTYNLVVFAHSTVAGTFNNTVVIRIIVV